MKIKVNEQAQKFQLTTTKGYVTGVGHEIQVGKYRFCAIPIGYHINISEVTTGVRVINISITQEIYDKTRTKEDSMKFLVEAGEKVNSIINKVGNFDELIENSKKTVVESFGEVPQPENVDIDWMTDEIGDVMH